MRTIVVVGRATERLVDSRRYSRSCCHSYAMTLPHLLRSCEEHLEDRPGADSGGASG
jgi:hypothetical protein